MQAIPSSAPVHHQSGEKQIPVMLHLIPLCNQLNNTTSRGDLSLCLLANPSCAYYQWYLWDSALAEDFGVAEREEVEDGGGVGLLARHVGFASLCGDERPEL